MMENKGTLVFVGMGPGDPELMTLKAVRAIREADVIAVPDTGMGTSAVASIAGDLFEGKTLVKLYMPMRGPRESWREAHITAAETLKSLLDEGRRVAYPVLGDPSLFATSGYLKALIGDSYTTEIIPGVTAMCAGAAKIGVPLCEDRESLTVLAGLSGEGVIPQGNVVIMKANGKLNEILSAAGDRGTYLARNVGMSDEYAGPLSGADRDARSYFSTVLVKP